MITPSSLAIVLQGAPFPNATFTVTPGGDGLVLAIGDKTITFCGGAWFAAERRTTPAHLSFAAIPTAEQVHTEIRRVVAVLGEPAPSWEQLKADSVGPDLPGDDALQDRLTDEIDRRRDSEAQLAKVTAERDAERIRWGDQIQDRDTRIRSLEVERDDATARADKIEDRLRRDDELREQIAAAVGLGGSASLALILDMVKGGMGDKLTAYTTLAALLHANASDPDAAVKALHALKSRLKVLEVTAEQWEKDNATVADLLRLVSYHQAPIAFNARPLTLAERAAFVIRRLWQGRTNAANEAASLRRELSDIADALGDLPDTAEREPIGARVEHLGLSTAERIRLTLTR